jgi:hypothetical protein
MVVHAAFEYTQEGMMRGFSAPLIAAWEAR